MARNLLTALEIKTSEKTKLRDGDGLWLHTNKSGNRSWVFIYVRHGRRREMGFGRLADVSLAAARSKANEARAILAKGGDPFKEMTERKARIKPMLFGEMVRQYIETMSPKWRGSKTLPAWQLFQKTYARPLRNVAVAEMSTEDVVRVLRPIWSEKPETATKVAEWFEFDIEEAVWTIPAGRMKSAKPHRVPLSDRVVEIVRAMQQRSLNHLVFPGQRPMRPISEMTFGKVIQAHGGADATTHGFRSAFRDWAADETDHQREVIEAAIAHAVGDAVERAYRRGDALEKRRALMQDWANYCAGGANGAVAPEV
jgi:hypothetical protein